VLNILILIFFGHNKEECQKLNWEKKIEEMKINLQHGEKEI
jgi:hypothetical protein